MGAFEIVGESVQIGSVDLELADITGDVLVELLADFYQFVLQLPNLVPGRVIAINAGAVIGRVAKSANNKSRRDRVVCQSSDASTLYNSFIPGRRR